MSKIGKTKPADPITINLEKRPRIVVRPGELPRIYDEAEVALAGCGRVFNRAGILVVLTDDGKTVPLKQATIRMLLARVADWVKPVVMRGGEMEIPADPPRDVGEAMLAESAWPTIPELKQVVEHPVFLNNGRLLGRGYDPESKFYGNFAPLFDVQLDATLDDAKSAAQEILDLFKTLDLETESDRAAVLATTLAAVCRPVLRTSLLIVITAPTPGSGKGLLARVVARFAQPGEPAAKTLQGDDDEIKKELLSALVTSAPVLFFDEVSGGEIDSTALRTLATSEFFSGRWLGQSKEINVSTRALVLITGNNITPAADSCRRMLEIRLNPRCETPSTRIFSFDPIASVDKNRNRLIRAALTIQSAYLHAGSPSFDVPATGSFEDWHRWCRLPVLWVLGIDPAHRIIHALAHDPHKAELAAVLEAWHLDFGSNPTSISAAIIKQRILDSLRLAVPSRPGTDPSAVAIGRWFAKNKDRIAGGFHLRQGGMLDGRARWIVEKIES